MENHMQHGFGVLAAFDPTQNFSRGMPAILTIPMRPMY